MSYYMIGYGNGKPYFCEDCGQLSTIDIQISDYKGTGKNMNVCLDCMAAERKREKKRKKAP